VESQEIIHANGGNNEETTGVNGNTNTNNKDEQHNTINNEHNE